MLGAVAAFIIERNFFKAAAFAFSSAVLTFFGLMHGKKIGFNQTPDVAVSYSLEGLVLVGMHGFCETICTAR